jgi:hypothetical protein
MWISHKHYRKFYLKEKLNIQLPTFSGRMVRQSTLFKSIVARKTMDLRIIPQYYNGNLTTWKSQNFRIF